MGKVVFKWSGIYTYCQIITVLTYLRKVGIYKRFEGYKQFYKEWEDMFISGMKYYDIAKKYNCCSQTVLHHLKQVNLFQKGIIQDG